MNERIYPLTVSPHIFLGKKAAAVLFGDERVEVKTSTAPASMPQ
jgi:hypothetical protein